MLSWEGLFCSSEGSSLNETIICNLQVYLSTTKDVQNVRKKDTFIRWSLDKITYGARFRNDENAQKVAKEKKLTSLDLFGNVIAIGK